MSPAYLYFLLIISKGIFISCGEGVLAYHGEGLELYLLYHVILLLIVNLAVTNWSESNKLSKDKKEKRAKTAARAHRIVAVLSFVLMLLSFFARQVLYADRIDIIDEENRLVESVSLKGATISEISFVQKKKSRRSTYYELRVTVNASERYFDYRIEVKNLRKLYDFLYAERKPEIAVSGELFYDAYLKTHKKLSAEDREFLSSIVGC